MVARRKKVIAVDFDGTLLRGNSLKLYMRAGVAEVLSRSDFRRLVRVFWIVGLRQLRLVSHQRMKFSLLSLIGRDEAVMVRYKALVSRRLNERVLRLLEETDAEPVVVSAAFDFCIDGLVPYTVLATAPDGSELRGLAKVEILMDFLEKNDAELEAVVTDSVDDLPLLLMDCDRRILVTPSRRILRAAIEAGVPRRSLYSLDDRSGLIDCNAD